MVKIRILSTGQVYQVESDLELKTGQELVAEADGIVEPAVVICDKKCAKGEGENNGPATILRVMGPKDESLRQDLKNKAEEYLSEASAKAFRHGLDIKIIKAELSFDEKKLTFYFTAENRVDFRSLVSDMVGTFRKIIRLQQVGPRDEAKIFGGFGKCGRPLCCSTFLNNLESVTLEMAEVQELATTKSNKITGCCGKLMCCLSYEQDLYKENRAKMPKIGSHFAGPEGSGIVVGHNIVENKAVVETKDGKKIEVAV